MTYIQPPPSGSLWSKPPAAAPKPPAASAAPAAPAAAPKPARPSSCLRLSREEMITAREAAIAAACSGAPLLWMDEAMAEIFAAARSEAAFTVDLVQARLAARGIAPPREPRAMGAAIRLGWIEATGQYEPSIQPGSHGNPRMIWRSRLR